MIFERENESFDIEVPLDITANELLYGLNKGLNLGINMEEISKALATTASIFNYTYPSGSEKDVTTEHSNMDQKLIQFKSDITAHESDIVNDVTKVTEQMINQISVVNKTIGAEWKDLKDYNS